VISLVRDQFGLMEGLNIESFHKYMSEYRKQMQKGDIQEAYKRLMEYIMNHFKNKYPDYFVSGSIYYGYMDMTYFSFIPDSLKQKKLKQLIYLHISAGVI